MKPDVQTFIDRLKSEVPDLGGRVQSASEFVRLTASGGEPTVTPVAFVIPSGLTGGQHNGNTSAFVQSIEQLWTIVLMLRNDTVGARVLDRVNDLIGAIIVAIAGWDVGIKGLFLFRRSQLVRSPPGSLCYEISFSIADRIVKTS